jgi:hydroxymethylpyrimidine pyrophosphatase-like HAD family hydrolase
MGNAHDEVKARAKLVTATNEDEGFAKAIDMILQRDAPG